MTDPPVAAIAESVETPQHLYPAHDEIEVVLPGARTEGGGRVHPRYEVDFAIALVGGNNFWVGESQNISEGGIFIACQYVLPIGTPVSMTFRLPESSEPLVVTGVVKWLRADAQADGAAAEWIPFVKAGMGIQFHQLGARELAAIRAFTRCRTPEFFD